jgi:hypothetical protein
MTLNSYNSPHFGDLFMITWDMGDNILVLAAEDHGAFIGDARRGQTYETRQAAQTRLDELDQANEHDKDFDNMSVRQVKEFMEMRYQVNIRSRGVPELTARVLWCLPEEPHSPGIYMDVDQARQELKTLKAKMTRYHQDQLTEISRLTL